MSNPTTIKGKGAPTMTTQGAVGQIYIDTDTGIQYRCIEAEKRKSYKVDSANYTWVWRKLSADFLATDEEVKSAMAPFIFNFDDLENEVGSNVYSSTDTALGDKVRKAVLDGRPVYGYRFTEKTIEGNADTTAYYQVISFSIYTFENGNINMTLWFSNTSAVVNLVCVA